MSPLEKKIKNIATAKSLLFLCTLVLCVGCSVKFVYNNLDRVAGWMVADYIDLTPEQDAYFDAEIDLLLYWHRTTQLPEYARLLRKLAQSVAQPPSVEEFERIEEKVQNWAEKIIAQSLPMSGELLQSLDDQQVAELEENFVTRNAELLEPVAELSKRERIEKFEENVTDAYKRFIGKLTDEQKQLLNEYANQHIMEEEQWVAYRVLWQKDLLQLLELRREREKFSAQFEYMSTHLSEWYGAEFATTLADNEALRRMAGSSMLASLTVKQQDKFRDRLNTLAEDFEELAADDDPMPPPSPCLVACV